MINHMKTKPIIWTISGSDCSGGAGIAADIKTGHSLGVEICTLITANTAQNSHRLLSINPVESDILQQQFMALQEDKPPSVIKIGLVANVKQIMWLVKILTQLKYKYPSLVVVFDPVGQASVGGKLTSMTPEELQLLYPVVDIITPNMAEAQLLTGEPAGSKYLQAKEIQQRGITSVIIKGGQDHNSADEQVMCDDLCLSPLQPTGEIGEQQSYQLISPRIDNKNSHGGGCSFATALASFIAHGYLLRDTFMLAKAFMNEGLSFTSAAPHIDKAYYGAFEQVGWPNKRSFFPKVVDALHKQYANLPAFNSLNLAKNERLGLYPVVDSIVWIDRLLKQGIKIIQLRIKIFDKASARELSLIEEKIQVAIELCNEYPNTRLFINDYWQLAIKHKAYGVHIGQEDIKDADLAAIQRAGLRLGISTHGCYEFLLAHQVQPSYLAIGAIFPTKTKNMSGQIQGLKNLALTLNLAGDIPVVAIGGISLERTPKVWKTGVSSIAVVTAITEAEKPEEAAEQFKNLMS
jgi:hydroxymethylpyrimidine kinase/phosphomethylpyrimidine kinase/thiamine-phosphate diphosphorylase